MKKAYRKIIGYAVILALISSWISPSAVHAVLIGIDWFAAQNQNPWPGSPFTFEEYSGGNFVKLDQYIPDTGWRNEEASVVISTYYAQASHDAYAAVVYHADDAGTAVASNLFALKYEGDSQEGDYIVLQSDGTGYYPLWPSRGQWNWQPIGEGDEIIVPEIKTYVAATDKIIFLTRARNTGEQTVILSSPRLDFTSASIDEDMLRPESFTGFEEVQQPVVTTHRNSWWINQLDTNSRSDESPFAYLTGSRGNYNTLLSLRQDLGWGSYGWSAAGNKPPWIGPWFISADPDADGVVEMTVPSSGTAKIYADDKLELEQKAISDGLEFAVLLQNNEGRFYPLYPVAGEWKWQKIDSAFSESLPEIETGVQAGDRILYVVHSSGTSEADVLLIQATVDFREGDKSLARPVDFTAWNMPADPVPSSPPPYVPPSNPSSGSNTDASSTTSYANSWFVNNMETNTRQDDNPFAYLRGSGGQYDDLLTNYKKLNDNAYAWTNNGEAPPWVGPWFLSAGTGLDGIVEFTSDSDGVAIVGSSLPLELETKAQSDGVRFILVQQDRNGRYAPLYPSKGKWEWQMITDDTLLELDVSTGVQKGDRILYILNSYGSSMYDTIKIDPLVKVTANAASVPRPDKFEAWGLLKETDAGVKDQADKDDDKDNTDTDSTAYSSSWYVNQVATNSYKNDSPYVYLKGANGSYHDLLRNRKALDDANYAWTNDEEAPPWIGPWFMSANAGVDGVIAFVADTTGEARVQSSLPIRMEQQGLSDGLQFIVVQSDGKGKYYPLFPEKGMWNWLEVEDSTEQAIDLRTFVQAGDNIMFIARSTGQPNNDTITVDPLITVSASKNSKLRPQKFVAWVKPEDAAKEEKPPQADATIYTHSWFINNGTTNTRQDDNPFAYVKGFGGTYDQLLSNYKKINDSAYAWTNNKEAPPWAGPWFLSAGAAVDGVIEFTAEVAGTAIITSTLPVGMEPGSASDGFKFMIVQKNAEGHYAPLYPFKGKWEWENITKTTSLQPHVATGVKEGDRILYIVSSAGDDLYDTLMIDPQIELHPDSQAEARPASFTAWGLKDKPIAPGNSSAATGLQASDSLRYVSSWYISNTATNDRKDDNPFAYLKGTGGIYNDLLPNRKTLDGGNYAWTNEGEGPPWVGQWFLSGNAGMDGVIEFTVETKGDLHITSSLPLQMEQKGASDGLQFMIVQSNSQGGYYPLFPKEGQWDWLAVNDSTEMSIDIRTGVAAGDRILFVAHSTGLPEYDTITLDPQITLIPDGISRKRPAAFSSWSAKDTAKDHTQAIHSQYFKTDSPENGPFSYLGGYNSVYELLDHFKGEWNGWTRSGGPPTVGVNYLSATVQNDAVIAYQVPASGMAAIGSNTPVKLSFSQESDGVGLIIVLNNERGEHPLWPVQGVWDYKQLAGDMELELPEIQTFVREGDSLHFIARSFGSDSHDTFEIDPVVLIDIHAEDSGEILPDVPRLELTDHDYIASLPDIEGLSLSAAAGIAQEGTTVSEDEKEEAGGRNGISYMMYGAIALGLVIAGGIAALYVRRHRAKAINKEM